MYKDDDIIEEKKKMNQSGFKKSYNRSERMSLFDWGSKVKSSRKPKISNKHRVSTFGSVEPFRKSADCIGEGIKMNKARKTNNRSYYGKVYGVKNQERQIRSLTATKN